MYAEICDLSIVIDGVVGVDVNRAAKVLFLWM